MPVPMGNKHKRQVPEPLSFTGDLADADLLASDAAQRFDVKMKPRDHLKTGFLSTVWLEPRGAMTGSAPS